VLFGVDCNTPSLLVIVNLHHENKGEIQMRTIYGIQNIEEMERRTKIFIILSLGGQYRNT
jgi:hypothetical protein